MRHKFRAWDKLEKRMVRVNAIDFKNREFLEIECDEYRAAVTCPRGTFPEHFELMQFTGLKDKDSVPIYEGDIIEFTEQGTGQKREVHYKYAEFLVSRIGIRHLSNVSAFCKVIGSKWEHPELLEG